MLASPHVAWGYWHDGVDQWGDHRFDWGTAGDALRTRNAAARHGVRTAVRWENPALRCDDFRIVHVDRDNQVLAFTREFFDNRLLVVVNVGDHNFSDHSYEVATGSLGGEFTELLCTQDKRFGGWPAAGNTGAKLAPGANGRLAINLPQWSVVILRAN